MVIVRPSTLGIIHNEVSVEGPRHKKKCDTIEIKMLRYDIGYSMFKKRKRSAKVIKINLKHSAGNLNTFFLMWIQYLTYHFKPLYFLQILVYTIQLIQTSYLFMFIVLVQVSYCIWLSWNRLHRMFYFHLQYNMLKIGVEVLISSFSLSTKIWKRKSILTK